MIVEEPGPLGPDLARLLTRRGLRAFAVPGLEEAIRFVQSSSKPVACFVSSTLAAAQSELFDHLLQQKPRPIVRFLCTGPIICPVHPGLRCPDLDCIHKPTDFMASDVAVRIRSMLRHEIAANPAHSDLIEGTQLCFARPVGAR